VNFCGVFCFLPTMKSAFAATLITTAVASKCSGTADPSGPTCFEGTAGALGVTETVKVNLEEVNAGAGKVSFTGEGVEAFTCSHKDYTHNGLDLALGDVSDCLPDKVQISKLQYCSDSDEVDVSVKVSVVPLPIKAKLTRVACDGENFNSCKGSDDPVVSEPACYEGRGGALGLTENVKVTLNDFAGGAGSLDFSGDGIIGFTCSGKKITKSGQDVALEDSSDCLPHGVDVSSIKYCSDSDTIKITVRDKSVPLPVSAQLSRVACSADALEVAVTGACTADEQAALADPQVVGKKANDCGTSSYNILTGNFNHDKFNSCFSASAGISTTCSECYAATGEYGAKNCKADCLLGWCKSGCLSCTAPAQDTLATCTGFTAGTAEPCEEITV
jgi:hypothetical protein